MKKIVPFKKDLNFKSNVAEITSIALDHDLVLENRVIRGNLIVSGSYKMNDISINTEEFKYTIPVNIEMSDKYILDNLSIAIDDFYYEIINNNILNVSIEVGLDNLEEQVKESKPIILEAPRMEVEDVKTLFTSFDEADETYTTYKVCIVKENQTVESIALTYNISKELLEQYNDLSDLKIGDKLIIPALINEKD
ncbi:MAG: LysM peptidoglycan-binding domain-containing protein [Bacilli bacterium]